MSAIACRDSPKTSTLKMIYLQNIMSEVPSKNGGERPELHPNPVS